jgi:2-polyprenyl-3-methyl-5-hydroxy-6-metoxy-1,4-benzoquinol methylase
MKNPNQFWDQVHSKSQHRYLAFSGPQTVLEFHKIHEKDLDGKRVMDIGVGSGAMSKHMSSCKAQVVSVDISPVGLAAIPFEKYLSKDIAKCAPVDIAVCHLVFQHCEDDEVKRILKEIKLKPGGFISFQAAELLGPCPEWAEDTKNEILVFRGEAQLRQLIAEAGRSVLSFRQTDQYHPIRWFFFRVA